MLVERTGIEPVTPCLQAFPRVYEHDQTVEHATPNSLRETAIHARQVHAIELSIRAL
jgi:hypothetical protein